MIKTYDVITELTHANTHDKQREAAFSVTEKAETVRFGLNLNVDSMYLEKLREGSVLQKQGGN